MTVTCDSALMTSGNTVCDQYLKKHSLSSKVHGGEMGAEERKKKGEHEWWQAHAGLPLCSF